MPKYESHITCYARDGAAVAELGQRNNWKYSCIDGDALMGAKPFCYLTAYEPSDTLLMVRMLDMKTKLEARDLEVLRTKVERIIWDSKTGVDEVSHENHIACEHVWRPDTPHCLKCKWPARSD